MLGPSVDKARKMPRCERAHDTVGAPLPGVGMPQEATGAGLALSHSSQDRLYQTLLFIFSLLALPYQLT